MEVVVSVIIPCYNAAEFIERCVESVMEQTFLHKEVICVDNASTDSTFEKLKTLQQKYPELILAEEPQKGANFARNTGTTLAKGKWMQYLDADDVLLPEKIGHQIELLEDIEGDVDLVMGACSRIKGGQNEVEIPNDEVPPLVAAFINQAGNTCANLWRKEAVEKAGMWNVELQSSQETDLMLRILETGKAVLDTANFTQIIMRNSGNISSSEPTQRWKTFLAIRAQLLDKISVRNDLKAHLSLMQTYFLSTVMLLALYDLKAALTYANQYIPRGFKPLPKFGFSKSHTRIMYHLLGVEKFIRLKS
tara:strand:+ start:2350 stop:3267 length:918 start_codon:yes stop_codon:yes gene_type:complete